MDLTEQDIYERLELGISRLEEIDEDMWNITSTKDAKLRENLQDYFQFVGKFLLEVYDVYMIISKPTGVCLSMDEYKHINNRLFQDIFVENYDKSYGNPIYACEKLGDAYGKLLCFLYSELRCAIPYAYENKKLEFVSLVELFLEIYQKFSEDLPAPKYIKESIYYYMYDYADVLVANRILETNSCEESLAKNIIMESDLSDLRYLYRYGEYIGENEIKTAQFLNSMDEEAVKSMARTYVNGFIEGFKTMRIDLTPKKTVCIRYFIGQERMVRYAIEMFQEHNLKPILSRYPVSRINRKLTHRIGYAGTSVNKQYDYDHRMDEAIFMDKAFLERKLEIVTDVYEKNKEMARVYAGPAVIEVFGETPFEPLPCEKAIKLSEKQQALSVEYTAKNAKVSNKYIPRDQYSFTIIAYPIPEIGENFEEIFAEIVKVNTLDNQKYRRIQGTIIDALNEAQYVHVVGQSGNKTDIKVYLHKINKEKETNFENCVADVNIPVGEVFTSPVLTGTNGCLHVSSVYLNDLKYVDLCIDFEDGRIKDFTCKNFENEEENKAFIKENLMFNHETLPIGEFAIGTNTTAYCMAHKYDILYKLPILIVEKMGPHFAVGDTCYSYSEDSILFNPDGKEIVAKDNECSILRKSEDENERAKAYFNCHTDITIPYEEIGGIYAVSESGCQTAIIENGRFVLPGTEELNLPFEQ